MNSSPLIVLNALVIRGDTSVAEGTRSARPKYNVNRTGEGVEDAGTSDKTLALTTQAQLEWEAFDEYWRKTHGPKILHQEGSNDRVTSLLRYYLQQHRIPGGPCSENAPPYRAKTTSDGLLVPDPAARCEPYIRPAWDGVAQLAYDDIRAVETFFDVGPGKYGDKIVPDEAVFLRGFGFNVCEEHVQIQNGDKRRDPIILIKNHTRNADLSRSEFRERWMNEHADVIKAKPQAANIIRRYAQLHNISKSSDKLYDAVGDAIDGITVMSFANMNDLEEFLCTDEYATIAEDEASFAIKTSYFTALNYVIRDTTLVQS
ncbi:MAG TPA: hypothetical protein ENH48_01290 [Halieaceae bacterium]|nr:MAG: hypothetical protein DRQ97_01155 [Gammaproteobacteria bacterium]HDY81576.1 hypothetical protein [Halieaceae bacterium]